MPLRFGNLNARSQQPLSSAQMVRPATLAGADLQQQALANNHLTGTSALPRASDQLPPLQRGIDPSEPMHQGQLSGTYATPAVSVMDTNTVVRDTPQQMIGRAEQMDTNRLGAQQRDETQRAITFQSEVIPPQLAQKQLDQGRVVNQQINEASYRDGTADVPEMQQQAAQRFAINATLARLSPEQLAIADQSAARLGV